MLKIEELERKLENFHRVGTVPKNGVKYDEDKKRWYVKLEQKKDSGTFTSDWLPWETQANAYMKVSSPPAEGQSIQLISPFGTSELGSCSAYHNNQDTPSPSGKAGEHHIRIEKPNEDGKPGTDPKKILNIGYTQDGSTVQIGDTTHVLTADAQTVTTKNNSVATENDTKTVSDTPLTDHQ